MSPALEGGFLTAGPSWKSLEGLLIYNVVQSLLFSKTVLLYMRIHPFSTLLSYGLSQDIGYSFLCSAGGPRCLSMVV